MISLVTLTQTKYTLSGFVRDSLSGESLIGATVQVQEDGSVSSNQYGFYSLTLPKGNYTILVSFAGYQLQQLTIQLDKNINRNFQLLPRGALQEVIVSSKKKGR